MSKLPKIQKGGRTLTRGVGRSLYELITGAEEYE
jgi:hypothetical protein